ncbi:hypothetical protein C8R47DRAFT_1209747 [Mycena vitilis]|nr:hypothetical protein C8R47DRAFT_1209747 [Mycena vitilis]
MAPSTPNPTHNFTADESWESQLVCLFGIIAFVLLYTLCCHLYSSAVGSAATTAGDLDRILGPFGKETIRTSGRAGADV